MDIEVREPVSEEEFDLYYALRWRILREPWTTSRESGRDDREDSGIHLGAWSHGHLVGAGRLHLNSPDEAQVRYMAVEEGWNRRGIGSLILRELESRAAQLGVKRVILNARDNALPFYRVHGYQCADQSNVSFGSIIHWWMRKELQGTDR